LLKNYNKLWVFGDSHSTPGVCVSPHETFWALMASALKINTIINCSRPKLSFDSVCHILIGEQAQYNFEQDFFIIGLPPLERITIFDNYKDTALSSSIIDTKTWQIEKNNISSHHGLINLQYAELDKLSVLISDRSWLETQILRQVFLITQWLDKYNANYAIVNLSKNLDKNNVWDPSQYILDYCLNHSKCDLFDNSLYDVNLKINEPADFDQYGWFGHHGPAGNKHFFEKSLLPIIQRTGLC
jgi:hypothetical protein